MASLRDIGPIIVCVLVSGCIKPASYSPTKVQDSLSDCPPTEEAAERQDHSTYSRIGEAVYKDQLALLNSEPGPKMLCPSFQEKARFDWNARTFSPLNSAILAEASFQTYFHASHFEKRVSIWAQPAGSVQTNVLVEPTTDTQAYLAWNPNPQGNPFLIVNFRGTSSKRDFLIDGKLIKSAASGRIWGSVHQGFQESYLAIRPKILEAMNKIGGLCVSADASRPIVAGCTPSRRLVVTGHSLGGALATLLAADLTSEEIWANNPMAIRLLQHQEQSGDNALHCETLADPNLVRNAGIRPPNLVGAVYTFGSPRVGDRYFAKCYTAALDAVHFRVNYGRDLVSRGPNLRYLHVGKQFVHYSRGPNDTTQFEILPSDPQRQSRVFNLLGEFCAASRETVAALALAVTRREEVLIGDHLAYPAPLRWVVDPSCPSGSQ